MRTERFGLALTADEKEVLDELADYERIPAAAVIRRLLWQEARRLSLLPANGNGAGTSYIELREGQGR